MSIKTLKDTAREAEIVSAKYKKLYETFESQAAAETKKVTHLEYDKRALESENSALQAQIKTEIIVKDKLEKESKRFRDLVEEIEPKVLDLQQEV